MISRIVVSLLLLSLSLSSAWLSPLSNRPLQTYSKTSMLLAQGPGGGRQTKKQIDSMIEFINEPVKKGQSVDQ